MNKLSHIKAKIAFLTGLLFLVLFYKFKLTPDFFAMSFLTFVLIAVSFIDLESGVIPNSIVIIATVGGAAFYFISFLIRNQVYGDSYWWNPIVGALLGSTFLFIIAVIGSRICKTKNVIGGGDIKILFPIGLFLGWRLVIICMIILILSVAAYYLISILFCRKNLQYTISLGPFISIAAVLSMIFGWHLINHVFYW